MENKDEIIRIQKDSITISQSEVEDLHKTLQEKVYVHFLFSRNYCFQFKYVIYSPLYINLQIDAQEKAITQYEKEKRQLDKQVP